MKNLLIAGTIVCASVLTLGSTATFAATITLTPGDCDDFSGGTVECLSGNETSNAEILVVIAAEYPDLVEVYKSNVGGIDEFQYADDYTTMFSDEPLDPENALIAWNGDPADSISCPDCFVLIKDGNQNPSWYLMELAGWDGKMDISLEGFWPDQGAISHVSLFSSAVVPVPAAVWLFGSGLLGLVGVARRKSHT